MADVSGEFGINATQAGLYMAAFFAGYLVTQIPGGIMAERYQPKYILIACTILGGAMTALMSRITSYEMGLVIRVITGISSGCVMAQCSKVVALTFAPQERASAMGVVLASPPFGITLAQSLGAPLNLSLIHIWFSFSSFFTCWRSFRSSSLSVIALCGGYDPAPRSRLPRQLCYFLILFLTITTEKGHSPFYWKMSF